MAATYNLISSQVLGSSAASVTFSSIPQTYTDLVLKWSALDDQADLMQTVRMKINGSTVSEYSWTQLYDSAGTVGSYTSGTATNNQFAYGTNGASNTANTFSSYEVYIPNYTVAVNKPFGSFGVVESNSANAYIITNAHLWRDNAAITSLLLYPNTGNFVANSSFYLYGLKSS